MSSARFPPIPPSDASGLGDALEVEVAKHHGSNPNFKYKDDNGAPIGPFAMLSYTPDLFPAFMHIGDALLNQKDLSPRARELAILAVTSIYSAPFVLYAHTQIALKEGLSSTQIEQATQSVLPDDLSEEEQVVYSTALALAKSRGPLEEETWERARAALGREKSARIAHVVGLYVYVALLLGLGDVKAPST